MRQLIVLIVAFVFSLTALAQNGTTQNGDSFQINLKNVSIDSLKKVIENNTDYRLYYRLEREDSLLLSFECNSTNIQQELTTVLALQNYTLTLLGNSFIVLKGLGIRHDLPKDYFRVEQDIESDQDYLNAISYSENSASLENKIYKIGESNLTPSDGRSLLRGYVKNLDSGEPIPGVSLFITTPHTATTTDAFGFYRILIPKGVHHLEIKGYGLEDRKLMLEVYGNGELDILMKDKVYALEGVVLSAESTQKMRSTQIGLERVRI
ncbi:MAG: carboxypeptidase-like regulatory domain-containing protein, partial [Bacteroidales bacterium]|nr:carboxypeptidase-like regulatory domain-containing protein [Bacteroidales bacterium]